MIGGTFFLIRVNTGVTLSFISIWQVFFRVSIFSKQLESSDKSCSSLTFTVEIRFIRFRLSLVDNPRISTDFESTTINETSKWSFLSFRLYVHWTEVGFRIKIFQNCQRNNIKLSSHINFF